MSEELKEIAKKVFNNPNSGLSISRLPKKTKEVFINLAEEDFCNDYGMTLKFLLDYYTNNEEIIKRIDKLEQKEESKEIKTLDGSVKVIKEEKNE